MTSEELVEKAARALRLAEADADPSEDAAWEDILPMTKDEYRRMARAVIALVIAESARVCELAGHAEQHDYGLVRGTQNYFRAARAIRALAPTEGNRDA